MNEDVELWYNTTFEQSCVWEGVDDVIKDDIRSILPMCFKTGEKEYEKIKGYDNLPWKTKHHLDIRMEICNDKKKI